MLVKENFVIGCLSGCVFSERKKDFINKVKMSLECSHIFYLCFRPQGGDIWWYWAEKVLIFAWVLVVSLSSHSMFTSCCLRNLGNIFHKVSLDSFLFSGYSFKMERCQNFLHMDCTGKVSLSGY